MECQQCKVLEAVIDELSDQLAREQQRRRAFFRTMRLLKQTVVRDMEQEHAVSQADGFSGTEG